MNFESRARHAFEKGEPMRALFLLVEGFKRQEGSQSSLMWMLELYATHNRAVGLEPDMISILSHFEDASKYLTWLTVQLEQHDRKQLVDALLARALSVGMMPAPMEDVFELETSSRSYDGVFMDVEVLDIVDETMDEDLETFDEPIDSALDALPWTSTRKARVTFEPRVESDVSEVETEQVMPEPVAPELETEFQPQDRTASKRIGPKGFALSAIALVVVGLLAWTWFDRGAGLDVLDQQMVRFNTLNSEPFERALEQSGDRWGVSTKQIEDRQHFVHALMAMERTRPQLSQRPQRKTPWSLAAAVLHDIQKKDYERAQQAATTLQHTHPNSLPTLWASARLAQSRGQAHRARHLYDEAHQRYPTFLYGMMARLRMAVERGDSIAWDVARRQLKAFDETHPYLVFAQGDLLSAQMFIRARQPKLSSSWKAPAQMDNFLRAQQQYLDARRAWFRRDLVVARAKLEQALTFAPDWFDATLMFVSIDILSGDLNAAKKAGYLLAARADLSVQARLKLMTVLPHLFIERGHHEDALFLSFDPGADASHQIWSKQTTKARRVAYAQKRPVTLALQKAQWKPYKAQTTLAFETRAYVLLESGYGRMGLETLAQMDQAQMMTSHGRLLRLWSLIRTREQQDYQHALKTLGNGTEGAIGRAMLGLLEQKPVDAQAVLTNQPLARVLETIVGTRVYINTLLENKKHAEALKVLQSHPWSPGVMWTVRSLTYRAMVRAQAEELVLEKAYKALVSNPKHHISRLVDLATASLYQSKMEQVELFAAQAIAMQPKHPQANLVMGLMYRRLRQYSKSQKYLNRAANQSDGQPVSNRQMASTYMELGRFEEARKLYYKAFLANRRDVLALAGIAKAFLKFDIERGQHEFARFYQGFAGKKAFQAQAGESSKWLAVLHGSRQGKEGALIYLKRAQKELGPRADVLIEYGRYHQAMGHSKKARASYIAALSADSTSAGAHLGLAKIAIGLKDSDMARDHLRKFLELQPFGEDARWAKQKLARKKSL